MHSVATWQIRWMGRLGRRPFFISYRRSEHPDITGRICDRLDRRFGRRRVIKDERSIPLGVDYRRYIEDVIPYCGAMFVIIGPDWLKGPEGARPLDNPLDLVRAELIAAFRCGIRVIPLLVGGAAIPAVETLPEPLRELSFRQGLAIRSGSDFARDMEQLMAKL